MQDNLQVPIPISSPGRLHRTAVSYPALLVSLYPPAAWPAPLPIALQQAIWSANPIIHNQATWSDNPTVYDPELIRATVGMPLIKSNAIPHVLLWLENKYRIDRLAALDMNIYVKIKVKCMSYSNLYYTTQYKYNQM